MNRRIIITRTAERDISEIWDYLATQASADAADRVQRKFEVSFRKLAEMPGLGHYRNDAKGYRFWRVYSYLIAYRYTPDQFIVYRVVSGYRNLKHLFR